MIHESIELIRSQVLTQLEAARKGGRTLESIKTPPHCYHHCIVAFMHQLQSTHRGVELFGVPLVIDHDIADIAVNLG